MVAPRKDTASTDVVAAAVARSSEGMIVTDADQIIIYANQAAQDLTGYPEEEMLGRNCRFLQGDQTDPATVSRMREALQAGEPFRETVLNYRKNGNQFWNDLSISPIHDPLGTITHFVSVQRDISELVALRENMGEQLKGQKREAETARLLLKVARLLSEYRDVDDVTGSIAEGIIDICAADRSAVALWDPVTQRLRMGAQSGWPAHLSDRVARFSVAAADLPELATLVANGRPVLIGPDASAAMRLLLMEYEATAFAAMPIFSRGALRGVLLAHWVTSDRPSRMSGLIEERLEGLGNLAAVALENAALLDRAVWSGTHDALTELPHRTLLKDFLHQHLAPSQLSQSVAVLYLDIDHFKQFNDSFGHQAGDSILQHVASVLTAATRGSDLVARVGGDEFVVALSHLDPGDAATQVAARVRALLAAPVHISGHDVFVTVSIGIAISDPPDSLDVTRSVTRQSELLIAEADAAMYRDKVTRTGNSKEVVDRRKWDIGTALHGAVTRGEISAHFQPQLNLAAETVTTVEALARWHHPKLGDVAPGEFISIAELNGAIHEVGAEILRQACVFGEHARAAGTPAAVAVNVSVAQLMHDDYIDTVRDVLAETGFPADQVIVEMTESIFVDDIPCVSARLRELRDVGMGVSLDDFGTGNTSLLQLYDLPLTELKIDQAFIDRDGPTGEALIQGIVDMAHSLDITVVTEGVETAHQLGIIRSLGSDRAQGYHISQPMNQVDALAWLSARVSN